MSIQIEVPLHLLQNPEVAQSLAELVRALAGQPASAGNPYAAAKKPEPAVEAVKAEAVKAEVVEVAAESETPSIVAALQAAYAAPAPSFASAYAAKAAVVEEEEDLPPVLPAIKTPKAPKVPAAAPVAAPVAPPAPVKAPAMELEGDLAERWATYLAELPEPSRRFLELLESRGQITVDEAVEALDLPGPKAMGGLTGAMRRWAPKKGVELPFTAITDAQNRRAWVWTGVKG